MNMTTIATRIVTTIAMRMTIATRIVTMIAMRMTIAMRIMTMIAMRMTIAMRIMTTTTTTIATTIDRFSGAVRDMDRPTMTRSGRGFPAGVLEGR